VYFSMLEDGTHWDTTFDYIERSWGADNVQSIVRAGRQLWLVGTATSEVWSDVGDATKPWQPIQGAFLDIGTVSPQSVVRDGDTITWVAQSEHGGGRVVRANGYNPAEQSHYGIAARIDTPFAGMNFATAVVTQFNGHQLYWLNAPGLLTTLVFDFRETEWHERARWDITLAQWAPHPIRSHCYANQRHFFGVNDSGWIYQLAVENMVDSWMT
jgi:hypothetical protein